MHLIFNKVTSTPKLEICVYGYIDFSSIFVTIKVKKNIVLFIVDIASR